MRTVLCALAAGVCFACSEGGDSDRTDGRGGASSSNSATSSASDDGAAGDTGKDDTRPGTETTTNSSSSSGASGSGGSGSGMGPCSGTSFEPSVTGYGLSRSDHPMGGIAEMRLRDGDDRQYDALGRAVGHDESLEPLVGYTQFWFAWAAFNGGSEVFGSDEPVSDAPIEATGDGCAAACADHLVGGPPKGVGNSGIPALTHPDMVTPDDENACYLTDRAMVVGIQIDDDVRAYPHNIFWAHEIVNDTVGGVPLAITHCPLTFSSITHDPSAFVDGQLLELGVSGKLFRSNLVFFLRDTPNGDDYDSAETELVFSQLMGVATGTFEDDSAYANIVGHEQAGLQAPRVPSFEMTWAAWKSLFPQTRVVSMNTGFGRNYSEQGYPYGAYFESTSTWGTPVSDLRFPEKEPTYGVRIEGAAKAYPLQALLDWAEQEYGSSSQQGVINDEVGGVPLTLVFDLEAQYVQAFARPESLELELVE